jgi:hypothetical protein
MIAELSRMILCGSLQEVESFRLFTLTVNLKMCGVGVEASFLFAVIRQLSLCSTSRWHARGCGMLFFFNFAGKQAEDFVA